MVIFPDTSLPYSVEAPVAIQAVEASLKSESKMIFAVAQRDPLIDYPNAKDLYTVGTTSVIMLIGRTGPTVQLIIQGMERAEIAHIEQIAPFIKAQLRPLPLDSGQDVEREALQRELQDLAAKYFTLSHPELKFTFPSFVSFHVDPIQQVYQVGRLLNIGSAQQQELLEKKSDVDAMHFLREHLHHEIQILEVRKKISDETKEKLSRDQHDYILRQQLKTIQKELGESGEEGSEVRELRNNIKQLSMPEGVQAEVEKELSRLEKIPSASPEYQVAFSHLQLVTELPWGKTTEDNLNLDNARTVLDEDHYNLKEIKQRIVEHLAVMRLNPSAKAPILCFVGPPGVGKTSLGQSIARALGRAFERFSLGGMHDEAELRGHRRTYIGAMPGRIIQAIRRCGAMNPLLMLDEVDKLGRDFRGDPAAALMEILDPEQNHAFRDNYLDLPFDLSKIFFITTANTIDSIPKPLLDRMETLRLSGYSDEEKMHIAHRYLVPRQLRETGLNTEKLDISDETLFSVIHRYTREAGVRELERNIGRIARRTAIDFAEGKVESRTIRPDHLPDILGPERFFAEKVRKKLQPGVAIGLAWTEYGGDVLYVEALALPKGEDFIITGHLGEVMKESAMAANSYVLSHSKLVAVQKPKKNVHLHVPAGAIPKDGPSAGVTMAVALASLHSGKIVRSDTAMTGEITLSGLVLPVGGIKEKILAARRAGIKRIILPKENEKDLKELPEHVRKEMEFLYTETIEEVLRAAFDDTGK